MFSPVLSGNTSFEKAFVLISCVLNTVLNFAKMRKTSWIFPDEKKKGTETKRKEKRKTNYLRWIFYSRCFSHQRVISRLYLAQPPLSLFFSLWSLLLGTSLHRVFRKLGGMSFITDEVPRVIMYKRSRARRWKVERLARPVSGSVGSAKI